MSKYYLGIDTSAYTTSLGIIDENYNIVANYRKILKVNKGNRGLRQQEAVFQHIKNLPEMIADIKKDIDFKSIQAIGYSDKPRNISESYMPVFNVSQSYGMSLAEVLGIKSYNFSHQEGHIAAGLFSNYLDKQKPFISIHLSGGTTEILLTHYNNYRYVTEIIGGTKDISAGQLIDRIGVKMELDFPSGKHLDKLSKEGELLEYIPVSTNGNWINFSGPETYFTRLIEDKKFSDSDIAKSVLHCINTSLERVLVNIFRELNDVNSTLLVGGVASNKYLRQNLFDRDSNRSHKNIIFADKNLCTDNGVGIAILACEYLKGE